MPAAAIGTFSPVNFGKTDGSNAHHISTKEVGIAPAAAARVRWTSRALTVLRLMS